MSWKDKVWRYVTVLIVLLIMLNPEMAEFALFVDAIGIEMFLMLVEVQVISILALFLNTRIKPSFAYIQRLWTKHFPGPSWNSLMKEPGCLLWVLPGPATLMHVLVVSAVIFMAINA